MHPDHDTLLALDEALGTGSGEHEITDAATIALDDGAALTTYRWRSRRGDQRYEAVMSSVYRRRPDGWRLVLHQQTPAP